MPQETIEKSADEIVAEKNDMPLETFMKVQEDLNPSPVRALSFNTLKQKNAQFIQKGLAKPGRVSFDVLRRAANSVHVARICINVLKEKVTKTEWAVQAIDQMKADEDDPRIEQITELLKHPNKTNETFRTLLDKMLEDLLILDSVSLEKTRFVDGTLAELHYVDSATIRPVFDQWGNQDVEIPLKHKDGGQVVLPVSYVQIMNNSKYGGAVSGEIVAAWPKKDFIHFHMHPQGAMEGFGYGLSPLEGVLSVVANLLNADNYNGTYFEEGAFPPVIIQLMGQINQRDIQAYREYLYSELLGNFHRPAIIAGDKKTEVMNLKEMTNRDMQFMDYTKFLARLLASAYGLAAQDIGLTDDLNKAISETQKDLSMSKGYGSILHLVKEVINQEIIWKDFGFTDLEFDWVGDDTLEPEELSKIVDTYLKNGLMTINEARQKMGELPYGEEFDQPMILTASGYSPMMAPPPPMQSDPNALPGSEKKPTPGKEDIVGGEQNYEDQADMKKSVNRTLYLSRPVQNASEIIAWARAQGFKSLLPENEMHVTVVYSKTPVDWYKIGIMPNIIRVEGGARSVHKLGDKGAVVLEFECNELESRWEESIYLGASHDYKEFTAHITLTYDGSGVDLKKVQPYAGKIVLAGERKLEINEDWHDGISEQTLKSRFTKAVYTHDGFKTFMDDRGYGQPFIYFDPLAGTGKVIKPPAAVNLFSQDLEVNLSNELADKGLNIARVNKMSYADVLRMLPPAVGMEFDKYTSMTPEYDSEKWRAKMGGSRKYPFYLVSDFIDGFCFNHPLLVADMKRDPDSYRQAIKDLARMWKVEKELVLGDRRADQYIITPDKRAFGIDYQFKGNESRWRDTKNAIPKLLEQIPDLLELFNTEISEEATKSWFKRMKSIIKNLGINTASHTNLVTASVPPMSPSDSFETLPVMFGELCIDPMTQESVRQHFRPQSTGLLVENGYTEHSFTYDFNQATKSLGDYLKNHPTEYGGIVKQSDGHGMKYVVFTRA